jgi:hypothetical protein
MKVLSDIDFTYLLKRLKRQPDSPAGRSLAAIFQRGVLPGVAAKETGIPHVRFDPIHAEAVRIVSAMTLSEADGLAPEEIATANKALAIARTKECAYVPTQAEYLALEYLHKSGGTALKSISPRVSADDGLPLVKPSTLWILQENGAVESVSLGGFVFQWTMTPLGVQLRKDRFKCTAR